MLVKPNYTYDFTFKSALSSLNGIYTVVSVISYAEMLTLSLDLFTLTYKPKNISSDVFNSDLDTIRAGEIVKLVSVTDKSNIHYIPTHFFDKIPDGSVQKYFHLGLAIDLGIYDDPDSLSVIRNEVEQVVATMLGVTNKTVIYTVDNKWMTTADYAIINAERKSKIQRVSNNYTDKLALLNQVNELKTLVTYYEGILKAQS